MHWKINIIFQMLKYKMTIQYLKVDNTIRSQAKNPVKPFFDLQCSTRKHFTVHKYCNILN